MNAQFIHMEQPNDTLHTHTAKEGEQDDEQVNVYMQHYMPMLLAMTFQQPLRYWEMEYTQQLESIVALREQEELKQTQQGEFLVGVGFTVD